MNVGELGHVVWCDLEVAVLKIHSSSPWDTKMVNVTSEPDVSGPIVNVYLCDEDDEVFEGPGTYRENVVRRGLYRGHHVGPSARLKHLDHRNIALSHPDPGVIIWSLIVKHVLTVCAMEAGLLHLKGAAVAHEGKAYLLLGRGGGGKTEMARVLCAHGARLMANTHLLVNGTTVCGVSSNVRVRDGGRDVYVPPDRSSGLDPYSGWLPIGAVLWVKYRTDGQAVVETMPAHVAKANLRYFSESISNWELKEDVADQFRSDPFALAGRVNRIDELLDEFCRTNDIYYANVDAFSPAGVEKLVSVMGGRPATGREEVGA
ncbi:hypothetical protein [Cellulomonas sp. URHB0016]